MTRGLKQKLDYEDYVRLPDDGKRYEIIDGELNVTAAPVSWSRSFRPRRASATAR